MNINKCGKIYTIKKTNTETTKELIERSWFVVNSLHYDNKEKVNTTFKEAEKMSRIWFNHTILGCYYNDNISKKIQDLEDKVFV